MTHSPKATLYPSPRTAAKLRDPGSTYPLHQRLHDGPRLKAGVTVEWVGLPQCKVCR